VAPVAGNPVFRQLYNKTLDTFPGAVFLLFAAVLFLAGAVNLSLYFMRRKMIRPEPEDPSGIKMVQSDPVKHAESLQNPEKQ
jgi:hypothetical protein